MLLLHLVLTVSLGFNQPAFAGSMEPSTVGPAIEGDAGTLWMEGRTHFGNSRYNEAATAFQRLIDRYPSARNYLEAHLLLGLTRLRLNQPEPAAESLKYYITATSVNDESLRARLALGQVYLATHKNHEALLSAMEVIKASSNLTVREPHLLEAYLNKAWALIGLNRDSHAKQTLDAFWTKARKRQDLDNLKTQASRIGLELKLRTCARLPGKGALAESLTRPRIKQRSSCMLETLIAFNESLSLPDDEWILASQKAVLNGFTTLAHVCANPPAPPGRRSQIQLKRYRDELVDALTKDFEETRKQAADFLESWIQPSKQNNSHHLKTLLDSIKAIDIRPKNK